MRRALSLGALVSALVASRPAAAVDVRLEVSLGATIPMGPILSGLIQSYDLNRIQPPEDTRGNLLFDLHNKVGFSGAFSLMLNDFELRYDLSILGWSKIEYTHVSFSRIRGQDIPASGALRPEAFFIPFKTLRGSNVGVDIGGESIDPLRIHSITFGYRFTLFRGFMEPYIPVAFGLAIAEGGLKQVLLGTSFQLGLGFDFHVTDLIGIVVDTRYNWILLQNPTAASTLSGDPAGIGAILTTNASALSSVVQSGHLLLIHVGVKFHL